MFRSKKGGLPRSKLRTFNNLLTVVVLGLGVYIIAVPFLPFATLWWDQFSDTTNGYRYQSQLAEDAGQTSTGLAEPPKDNTLVVPSIQVDQGIIEGPNINSLSFEGVWRRPQTSTPDQGGNTVIVAHRFSYTDPATFYHLDKVELGEKMAIWWEGAEYIYEVFDVVIVDPSQVEIEAPTNDPILTLYTCTPVWTAAQRLVVKARLVNTDVLEPETNQTVGVGQL